MAQARRSVREVAVVFGADTELGQALALGLAARAVETVATGRDEKALGRVVGEIAAGGGTARHVAGNPGDPAVVAAVMKKTVEAFGSVTILVAASLEPDEIVQVIAGSRRSLAEGARVLVASSSESRATETRPSLNEVIVGPDVDRALDLALFLCSEAARGIAGQAILIA
jgi:hypothetical protein